MSDQITINLDYFKSIIKCVDQLVQSVPVTPKHAELIRVSKSIIRGSEDLIQSFEPPEVVYNHKEREIMRASSFRQNANQNLTGDDDDDEIDPPNDSFTFL